MTAERQVQEFPQVLLAAMRLRREWVERLAVKTRFAETSQTWQIQILAYVKKRKKQELKS